MAEKRKMLLESGNIIEQIENQWTINFDVKN